MIKEVKNVIKFYRQYQRKRNDDAILRQKFYQDFEAFNNVASGDQKAEKKFLYPCLYDNTGVTVIEPIYFYQDAWAFERIVNQKPALHIDVGSKHTFVAHLSKVVSLTMVDIRPLSLPMDTIKFIEGSILKLPFADKSVGSLSSLCVIEHIGLGRYGDPIDPDGSKKAFKEITRILHTGANFYMSVPIEETNKVYFNAHRAFNEDYLLSELLSGYKVADKKYIYGDQYLPGKSKGFGIGLYHLKKI